MFLQSTLRCEWLGIFFAAGAFELYIYEYIYVCGKMSFSINTIQIWCIMRAHAQLHIMSHPCHRTAICVSTTMNAVVRHCSAGGDDRRTYILHTSTAPMMLATFHEALICISIPNFVNVLCCVGIKMIYRLSRCNLNGLYV